MGAAGRRKRKHLRANEETGDEELQAENSVELASSTKESSRPDTAERDIDIDDDFMISHQTAANALRYSLAQAVVNTALDQAETLKGDAVQVSASKLHALLVVFSESEAQEK